MLRVSLKRSHHFQKKERRNKRKTNLYSLVTQHSCVPEEVLTLLLVLNDCCDSFPGPKAVARLEFSGLLTRSKSKDIKPRGKSLSTEQWQKAENARILQKMMGIAKISFDQKMKVDVFHVILKWLTVQLASFYYCLIFLKGIDKNVQTNLALLMGLQKMT